MARLTGRAVAILSAAIVATACTSGWRSDQPVAAPDEASRRVAVVRYEGTLRRLLLLPPVFEPRPMKCRSGFPDDVEHWMETSAAAFLVDWKGYELVNPNDALPREEAAALAQQLGRWQATEPKGDPPDVFAAQLRQAAKRTGADGIVVLFAGPKCAEVAEVVLMFMIVGMPQFYHDLLEANFSAGFYAGRDGRLLRRAAINLSVDQLRSEERVEKGVETLLASFENAVPEVMTK